MSAATNSAATPPTASRPLKLASTSQSLPHGHLDYVLDVSFDYYGRRFATASGDRTVRVWDLNPDGSWTSGSLGSGGSGGGGGGNNTNEWQAHRGPVHAVSWAHPEFGQLLATAGADHAVVIWEEREGGFKSLATPERSADGFLDTNAGAANASAGGAGGEGGASSSSSSRWANKATLSDARRAVTSVEFAPRHLGLRLASGSADGVVRIYEALDTMNLNHWKLEAELECDADGGEGGRGTGISMRGANAAENLSSNENLGVTSLSWSAGRFEPATLVVGLSSGRVSIYRYNDSRRSWQEAIRLPGHATSNGIPRGVTDVAWAPNVGRSYHLIATCGKDNQLKVHRVKRGRGGKGSDAASAEGGGGPQPALSYEGTEVLDQGQAWRCRWNITGTVLASSGDGGMVKLWKSDFQGRWKCVSEIVGDAAGVATATALTRQ